MQKLLLFVTCFGLFISCSTSKKTTTTTTSKKNESISKPSNGIYEPDSLALNAIKLRYDNISLKKLQEGYIIYTYGPCINCHNAKNIYQYDEKQWTNIINEMAVSAKISDSQKDAVFKYVLSIKLSQIK
jgi:hypothetical protein